MSAVMNPIDDDEFLLRRIPVKQKWFDPAVSLQPAAEAFGPHREHDANGLSLSRLQSHAHPEFLTIEQVAQRGPSKDGYYVAVLRVRDLRAHGIQISPDPIDGDPGHVLLPDLNSIDRKTDNVTSWKQILANRLTLRVDGPFVPS